MKNILVVSTHSIVDIITNSSSELFVVYKDTSIDVVKEILKDVVDVWNKLADRGYYGDHYVRNKRNGLQGEIELSPLISFEQCFGKIYVYTIEMWKRDMEEIEKHKRSYDISWGYENEDNIGKIFIESKCENSIPYEMFDFIYNLLNAERYHLG